MEHIYIANAEEIRRAASEMQLAAHLMQSALSAHEAFLANWLEQLREVVAASIARGEA